MGSRFAGPCRGACGLRSKIPHNSSTEVVFLAARRVTLVRGRLLTPSACQCSIPSPGIRQSQEYRLPLSKCNLRSHSPVDTALRMQSCPWLTLNVWLLKHSRVLQTCVELKRRKNISNQPNWRRIRSSSVLPWCFSWQIWNDVHISVTNESDKHPRILCTKLWYTQSFAHARTWWRDGWMDKQHGRSEFVYTCPST